METELRVYNSREAALILGVSQETVLLYIRIGLLRARKVGRQYLILEEHIREMLGG